MGYGYDRRYGSSGERGGYGGDRGRFSGHDRDRGYGERDRDHGDRGFFDRAGDEVRSWFGDDDAERRRRQDERYDQRDWDQGRFRGAGYHSDDRYGSRDWDQGRFRGSSSFGDEGYERSRGQASGGERSWDRAGSFGGSGDQGRWDQGRSSGRGHHDENYRSWRDRQMEAFDRDYDEYRRENQGRFESEFGAWRQSRQGQRDMVRQVREHQDVVGSDGQHVGTVDHVQGDRIKLAKTDQDAGGRHHFIPCSWVQSVDDKVTLNKTADQAKQHWRDEARYEGGMFGGDDRGANLNRSFSGTY